MRLSTIKWRYLVPIVLLGLGACQAMPEEEAPDSAQQAVVTAGAQTIEVRLPNEVPLLALALAGVQSTVLRDQVKITGLTSSNVGLTAGNLVKVGDLSAVGNISVGSSGTITGNAAATGTVTLGTGTTFVGGKKIEHATLTVAPRLRWTYTLPTTTLPNVTIDPDKTGSAQPGRYVTVKVSNRAKLNLQSGDYFIEELVLDRDGKLVVPAAGVAPVIYVTKTLNYQGNIVDSAGGAQRPVIVYLGTTPTVLETAFEGTLIAPNASVRVASLNGAGKHKGSVIAKGIELSAGAEIVASPSNALVPKLVGDDLQACSDAIAVDMSLPEEKRKERRLAEIARYCMGFDDACQADFVGRVNLDYHTAALQALSGTKTPAQYLALSRDRTRKRYLAETISGFTCGAVRTDADRDLIPDNRDSCPNTPALTPTDDRGCTDSRLPQAPTRQDMLDVLDKMPFVASAFCLEAPGPTAPSPLSLGYGFLPGTGYVFHFETALVKNQPEGCPVFYHIEVQTFDRDSGAMVNRTATYSVEELTPTDTFAISGSAQGAKGDQWRMLDGAVNSGEQSFRYRVLATAGSGLQSGWSQWSNWYPTP